MTTIRRFRKNPHLPVVIVPGHGRVHDVDILEGDQYQHFAPHLLHEIGAVEVKPIYQSVPAAAAVPAIHDALAIAARETVPVEDPTPAAADPVQPPEPSAPPVDPSPAHLTMEDAILEQQGITPNEVAIFLPTETPTQPETNSANLPPNDTLVEGTPPAPVKNKGGRPRKVKPAPEA